jgi:nucleoside-diphosphate-sugar epimerase
VTQPVPLDDLPGELVPADDLPGALPQPVSSPRATVEGLIALYECTREAYGGRTALNLPALNVTVQEMLDALERVAGPAVRARVTFERNDIIAGIVARWPKAATARRAQHLGLRAEASFDDIIRQYIDDTRAGPHATQALKGMTP